MSMPSPIKAPLIYDYRRELPISLSPETHSYVFEVFANVVSNFTSDNTTSARFIVSLLDESPHSTGATLAAQFQRHLRGYPPVVRFIAMEGRHARITRPASADWFARSPENRWPDLAIEISADILALCAFLSWVLGREFAHLAQAGFGDQSTPERFHGMHQKTPQGPLLENVGWEWEKRVGGEFSLCYTGRSFSTGVITGIEFETAPGHFRYIDLRLSRFLRSLASADWTGLTGHLKHYPSVADFAIDGTSAKTNDENENISPSPTSTTGAVAIQLWEGPDSDEPVSLVEGIKKIKVLCATGDSIVEKDSKS